jgi:large subunit ribosomal protein L5
MTMAEKEKKTPTGAKGDKADKKAKAAKSEKGKGKAKGKAKKEEPSEPAPTPRLQQRYREEIAPALAGSLGRANRHAVPKLTKIVVNMGVGSAINDKKHLEDAVTAMTIITGQKPVVTNARKSIAGFHLREGNSIGCKVTLRGKRMYEFLDRLISVALPRVRDFRGLNPNALDGRGNYSLGLTEQLVFPELNPDKFTRQQGMNVTLITTAENDDEGRELLRAFGLPLRAA